MFERFLLNLHGLDDVGSGLPQRPIWFRFADGGAAGDEGDDGDKGDDAEDDGKDAGDDKDGGDAGDKKFTRKKDQDGGGTGGRDDDDKLFTQAELNDIVRSRLNRAEKKWKDEMEAEKKKAAMSEADRLKAEKEEAEQKATAATDRANQRLIRAEVISVATEMNIVDPEAAFALMDKDGITVEDDDSVKGVKKSLTVLVKSKPYLIKQADDTKKKVGDDQGDDKGKKGGFSMNDLIRKAAGRG